MPIASTSMLNCWRNSLSVARTGLEAGHYYLRAAEKVKEQYAYQKAVELCGRAIELLTHVTTLADERVHGLVLLGDLHSLLGNVEPANQYYELASRP